MDVFIGFKDAVYLFFSSFSTYTFLMTALAYQLFVLDITCVSHQAHFTENSELASRKQKCDGYLKCSVYGLILASILIFAVDFSIENTVAVNQLNRGTIIGAYTIVAVVFIIFSVRLLRAMKNFPDGMITNKHTRKVSQIPSPTSDPPSVPFLDQNRPWLLHLRNGLPHCLQYRLSNHR